MSGLNDLPERIRKFVESGVVAEFATVSAAGVPIDTPTYYFPSDDLGTIDVATGLPNPAKAERARRDPKVGLLIEGAADEPVVAIHARAAVRDADLAANTVRYLSETGFKGISHGVTWAQAREAVTYWSRIIIENTPERIWWWDNQAALDGPPQVWSAPAAAAYPHSDPAPSGKMQPSAWPVRPWREVAADALARVPAAHLSVLDEHGYPSPMRARAIELVEAGFRLTMPRGLPWVCEGQASVTFAGFFTFIGEASPAGDAVLVRVERALPEHPSTKDTKEVLQPSEDTRRKATARLEYEAQRRGQSVPPVPVELPPTTRLAKLRQARIAGDAPITGISEEMGNRTT
ncbi:pyridoxamine 5'-phosphate oxidase family protein [Phenylobacterium sp. LjRoot219]|uniref:pyridoxamine 5'-phosphate oxidase family protein n=1 Tax=Phenylobacterium sp. LjRoot219 TaxID=3342283 RepID=UPI003ED09C2F